jgi:hypothetical protein
MTLIGRLRIRATPSWISFAGSKGLSTISKWTHIMIGNPYDSPNTESSFDHDVPPMDDYAKNRAFLIAFLILPILFSGFGVIFYEAAGYCLEIFVLPLVGPPTYTYLLDLYFTAISIVVITGAAAGFTFSFYFRGFVRAAALGVLLVALIGAIAICLVWHNSEIVGCTSAIVLFCPPIGFCVILAVLSMFSLFLKTRFVE